MKPALIALVIFLAAIATRPHGTLGQVGVFLAGIALAGLTVIEIVKLYRARKG